MYSRRALEELILSVNAYHLQRRLDLQARYGEDVLAALDRAKTSNTSATVRVFKNKLTDLIEARAERGSSARRRCSPRSSTSRATTARTRPSAASSGTRSSST